MSIMLYTNNINVILKILLKTKLLFILFISSSFNSYSQVVLPLDSQNNVVYNSIFENKNSETESNIKIKNWVNDNYEAVKWLKNNDTLKWTGYFSLKRNKKSSEQFRLWLNIQTFKTGDSLHITVSDLKTQSLPDINIPDPQKTPLENLYKKYLKKQSKGKRSILYEEVLGMSDNFIKELIRNLRLYIEK